MDVRDAVEVLESMLHGLYTSQAVVDSVCDDYRDVLEKWPVVAPETPVATQHDPRVTEQRVKVDEVLTMAERARKDPLGKRKQPLKAAPVIAVTKPVQPPSPWHSLDISGQNSTYRSLPSISAPLSTILSQKQRVRDSFISGVNMIKSQQQPAQQDNAQRLAMWQTYRRLTDLLPSMQSCVSDNPVDVFREWYLMNRIIHAHDTLDKQKEGLTYKAVDITTYRNKCLRALNVPKRELNNMAWSGWWLPEDGDKYREGIEPLRYQQLSELSRLQALRNEIQDATSTYQIITRLFGLIDKLSPQDPEYLSNVRLLQSLFLKEIPCSFVKDND